MTTETQTSAELTQVRHRLHDMTPSLKSRDDGAPCLFVDVRDVRDVMTRPQNRGLAELGAGPAQYPHRADKARTEHRVSMSDAAARKRLTVADGQLPFAPRFSTC